jgi:hypothetical protein
MRPKPNQKALKTSPAAKDDTTKAQKTVLCVSAAREAAF